MKKLVTISAWALTAGSFALAFAAPAFADSLCPSGAILPGCQGGFNLMGTIQSVLNIILFVAFLLALGFLIYGGIKWILSGGEKDAANKARDTITSAMIGLAVILSAFILINVITTVILGNSFSDVFKSAPTLQTDKGPTSIGPGR